MEGLSVVVVKVGDSRKWTDEVIERLTNWTYVDIRPELYRGTVLYLI